MQQPYFEGRTPGVSQAGSSWPRQPSTAAQPIAGRTQTSIHTHILVYGQFLSFKTDTKVFGAPRNNFMCQPQGHEHQSSFLLSPMGSDSGHSS